MSKSGIHIKPSKKGTFTAAAKKHGKGVQEFARQVMANKENYSPAMVKKANADGYGSEVIYDAVYGRYGQEVENYVVELQNDISSDMGLHPKDDYEQIEQEAFEQILDEGMDSFVNPNDQDATRSKTNVPTDDLDSEDMTEIQDIDTGKEALKAERDPMLERILYLAKG